MIWTEFHLTYVRAREKMSNLLRKAFRILSRFLGSNNFSQNIFQGWDLHDEITGVCYGEVSMKCHKKCGFLSFFVKNG